MHHARPASPHRFRSRRAGGVASAALAPESNPITARVPWATMAALLYVLGLLTLIVRLLVQRRMARRIARQATRVVDPEWTRLLAQCAARVGVERPVTLLRTREQLMPMTMGTLTPIVMVPADADAWDQDRRQAVLLHELAHIARRDCLTQMLGAIACAVYWVHPAVWYVARRLRIEREVACDDRVLAAGAHAPNYAGHLLELAYTWSGRRAPAARRRHGGIEEARRTDARGPGFDTQSHDADAPRVARRDGRGDGAPVGDCRGQRDDDQRVRRRAEHAGGVAG